MSVYRRTNDSCNFGHKAARLHTRGDESGARGMARLSALSVAIVLVLGPAAASQPAEDNLRYVLSQGGLKLRESADPDSRSLTTAAYGAAVTVVAAAAGENLRVDNLSGGMAKVTTGGQTGYVFDGYLNRYPAPQEDTSLERYVEFARRKVSVGLRPHYERHYYDRDGHIIAEEGITLFQVSWQEAFVLAKALADIPRAIHLPADSREAKQTVENPDKPDGLWVDELEMSRDASGQITSIRYYARREGGGRFVAISRDDDSDGLRVMIGAIGD